MAPELPDRVPLEKCAEPLVEAPDIVAHEVGHVGAPPPVPGAGRLLNAGLLTLIVLIAGLTPIAARDAMKEMPPLSAGLLRFGVAAALLVVTRTLWPSSGPKSGAPIARRDWPRFLLAAVLCVPVNQVCFLGGVKLANASHAGLFYALNPVLVYVLTLALGRAAWSLRMAAAAVLAFAGAATIGWEGLHTGQDALFFAGDLLLFGAVASWAGYSVVAVPLTERYGAVRSLTVIFVTGVLLYSPVWLVDGRQIDLATMSWRALAGFAYITLITCYVNYMLWFVALTRIDINRLSVATNMAPLVAVVAAYFWLQEPIGVWLVAGGVLLLSAIMLANRDRLRTLPHSAA